MRAHVLGIPHTVSTRQYSSCAFTQKVVKLCTMLKMRGYHVTHYGHADSRVDCDEHVTVTTKDDLRRAYGSHDWKALGWPEYNVNDLAYEAFYRNVVPALKQRAQKGDFLLCTFGAAHKPVANAVPELIAVESGIGYPGGTFATFRIFESYAILHAVHGVASIATSRNDFWYDAVIPNAFVLDDFAYAENKSDYLLFLGRMSEAKGVHIAADIARKIGVKLIAAGQGDPRVLGKGGFEYVGIAQPARRKKLLRDAIATLCPSTFLEPFCGVQIESMLSGTPVISSDWGAFAEYNRHGETGYRCRTFEQFEWAARNIGNIKPATCRAWAEQFSLAKIAVMYDEYLHSVADVFNGGKGWYAPHEDRRDLAATVFTGREIVA